MAIASLYTLHWAKKCAVMRVGKMGIGKLLLNMKGSVFSSGEE